MVGPRCRHPAHHHVGVARRLDLLEPVVLDQPVEVGEHPVEELHESAGPVSLAQAVNPAMSANRIDASSCLSAMTTLPSAFSRAAMGGADVGEQPFGPLVLALDGSFGAGDLAQRIGDDQQKASDAEAGTRHKDCSD